MVSLKTKVHKHFNDNEKRCKALNEKVKVKLTQSNIIKQALSNQNLHNSSATKIIFDDKEDANECSETKNEKNNISKTKLNCKKLLLDNNSDSEEEVFEIKEKPQFHGKQGIKVGIETILASCFRFLCLVMNIIVFQEVKPIILQSI